MYNILVCDDEKDIVSALRIYLTAEGYRVFEAGNGAEALEVIDREDIHLALLDVMMPGMDGITALNRLREHHNLPVILLTAKSEDTDKVLGLNVGADDYVTKPFSPAELTARIDALYRRIGGAAEADPEVIVHEPFTLNLRNRTLEKSGRRIKLTQVEFAILQLFMQNPGRALSREDILTSVWGRDYDGELKIVDVNIRRLRIKIEDNTANPTYITTVWGYGYKWGL